MLVRSVPAGGLGGDQGQGEGGGQMSTPKHYTLSQLRGAFVAGQRAKQRKADQRAHDGLRAVDAAHFMKRELLALAEAHGPAMAYSRNRPGAGYTNVLIVNLFNNGGTTESADHVIDAVIGELLKRGHADGDVAYAEQCLESRLEESIANMLAMTKQGARPSLTIKRAD